MSSLLERAYNPDVLTCLANLSNDEVFTPPELANDVLDMLPPEIWSDPTIKILDPCCKSGVFLREAAKRFIKGLEREYPNLQERVDHIMHEQLFGIAITELTSLLSRRSLYCSKFPNGRFSVVEFDNSDGNVCHRTIQHTWENGRCKYCGASNAEYDRDAELESHAYEFIHTNNPERILNMKFDVIVGNPPYQLSDGGNKASAVPIYQKFVNQAIKLQPRFLSMIIPSRWYCGGRGLTTFRKEMLNDGHISELHDFQKSSDCFPGIRNGGGICYFLWQRDVKTVNCQIIEHNGQGPTSITSRPLNEFGDVFIRSSIVCNVIRKVQNVTNEYLAESVYSQKPFGLRTNFEDFDAAGEIKLYSKRAPKGYAHIRIDQVLLNKSLIPLWKVVTSRSTSVPEEDNGQVLRLSQTFIVEPNAVVTESYVLIGAFNSKEEAEHLLLYLKTKFFRFLCQPQIVSPDVSKRTFSFVPKVDLSTKWTDSLLYKKYNLLDSEIEYIETSIKEAN